MANFPRRPVAIDLFAGAGGFSLGIEQAGFDVAVAVEQDSIHAAVYAFNFPHSRVLRADIAKLSGQEIKDAVQKWAFDNGQQTISGIDLVFGGPPCQGFSMMGKGLPDDVRNNLVFEFCRLVKELQPRYFVMENVPGLRLSRYSHLLTRLLDEFKAAGYEITEPVQVLNAANFGVPQKRQRLFLLGAQIGTTVLAYPDSELQSKSQFVTVREAIADLPNLDDFAELDKTDCMQLTPAQLYQMQALSTLYVKKLRDLTPDLTNFAYSRWWNPKALTNSIQTQHGETSIERFQKTLPGKLEPISRLRRLDWNKPCHTLRAGTGSDRGAYTSPRPIHPEYPRVISVREAARLHSFPDWFRFHITKWHGFRQVGNAVPPLLARALGRQIMAALKIDPSVPKAPIELGDTRLLRFKQLKASEYWTLPESRID
jgi:DNA (cytosine-5)-methyltransferase 1